MEQFVAVRAGLARVEAAQKNADYYHSKKFLQRFDLRIFAVAAPGVKNAPADSEIPPWAYELDYGEIGPIVRTELNIVQPLYTFGKISHVSRSFKALVSSEKENVEKLKRELTQRLRYAVVQASLLQEAEQMLTDAYQKSKNLLEKIQSGEGPEVTTTELNKLKLFIHYTHGRIEKIKSQRTGITQALGILLNTPDVKIKLLDFYPEETTGRWLRKNQPDLENHPEIREMEFKVRALEEAYMAARAKYYPDIFLSGQVKYSYAPLWPMKMVSCTLNPNCFSYGGGLGVRLNLNYLETRLDVARAKARWEAARAALEALQEKLRTEWLNAFSKTLASWKILSELDSALKYARSNVSTALLNFDMGVAELKDVIDAYSQYLNVKWEYLKEKYNLAAGLTEMSFYDGQEYLP